MAVIGHDDIWREDKIEKQITFLEEHPDVGICFTWIEVLGENGVTISKEYEQLYHMMNADNYTAENWLRCMILNKSNWACAPSACIRRSVLDKTGYYRYGLVQLQDFDLWLRILNYTSVYVLQEKLTWYRQFSRKGMNLSDLTGDKGKKIACSMNAGGLFQMQLSRCQIQNFWRFSLRNCVGKKRCHMRRYCVKRHFYCGTWEAHWLHHIL